MTHLHTETSRAAAIPPPPSCRRPGGAVTTRQLRSRLSAASRLKAEGRDLTLSVLPGDTPTERDVIEAEARRVAQAVEAKAKLPHCPRGHALGPGDVIRRTARSSRTGRRISHGRGCRECKRAWDRAAKRRKRAKSRAS